jgi:hypothetical protein
MAGRRFRPVGSTHTTAVPPGRSPARTRQGSAAPGSPARPRVHRTPEPGLHRRVGRATAVAPHSARRDLDQGDGRGNRLGHRGWSPSGHHWASPRPSSLNVSGLSWRSWRAAPARAVRSRPRRSRPKEPMVLRSMADSTSGRSHRQSAAVTRWIHAGEMAATVELRPVGGDEPVGGRVRVVRRHQILNVPVRCGCRLSSRHRSAMKLCDTASPRKLQTAPRFWRGTGPRDWRPNLRVKRRGPLSLDPWTEA